MQREQQCVGIRQSTEAVDRQLSLDLDLFNRGGLAILDRIEAEGFDVLKARPRITKVARVRILMGSLARWAFRAA